MEEKKFNQKKFRELLKKGIGLRTQKEFAVQAGMSPATINRMLNEDVIARPKIKTLETLASHMHNVSYSELMDACGYETPGIEEVVRSLESDISDFFAFSDGISFFPSMEEMLENKAGQLSGYDVVANDLRNPEQGGFQGCRAGGYQGGGTML